MIFKNKVHEIIDYLTNLGFLKFLDKDDIISIFEKFDLSKITNLDYRDTLTLLSKLNSICSPIANKIFKDEIIKCYLSHDITVIAFIINRRYLSFINKDEIKTISENFDFTIIPKIKYSDAIPFLKKLNDTGNTDVKKILKIEIARYIESGDPSSITYIIENKYLKYLNKEELDEVFGRMNFSKITQLEYNKSLHLLEELANTGNRIARKIYNKEILRHMQSGDPDAIKYLDFFKYQKKIIMD